MLNRKHRIGNKRLIEALFDRSKIIKNHFLIFKYADSEAGPSQFAVIVSKKIYKKANDRNRLRRQIHEALRLNLPSLKKNIKALVIAKSAISDKNAGFHEINDCVKNFFNNIE